MPTLAGYTPVAMRRFGQYGNRRAGFGVRLDSRPATIDTGPDD